jgi:hypothetical protein
MLVQIQFPIRIKVSGSFHSRRLAEGSSIISMASGVSSPSTTLSSDNPASPLGASVWPLYVGHRILHLPPTAGGSSGFHTHHHWLYASYGSCPLVPGYAAWSCFPAGLARRSNRCVRPAAECTSSGSSSGCGVDRHRCISLRLLGKVGHRFL